MGQRGRPKKIDAIESKEKILIKEGSAYLVSRQGKFSYVLLELEINEDKITKIKVTPPNMINIIQKEAFIRIAKDLRECKNTLSL